jgi:colanic acid biosynthesis glycosyl transferase WcaI
MHVVFFNRSYWPDFGATGQLLTELTRDLVHEFGEDVTVVTASHEGRPKRDLNEGVVILRARGSHFAKQRFVGRALNYLSFFFSSIWASFRIRSPDVVVALTDPPIIGLVGWLTAKRTGAHFVFLCQDIFPEVATLLEDFKSEIVNGLLQRVNRFLVRRADRIIALGESMKQRLVEGKGASPSKITVIHNWADSAVFGGAPKDNAFSREHGLAASFVVMHAGNLGLSQNLDTLIDVAERLSSENVTFLFVGDGVRRPSLEEEVSRRGLTNVRFLPYQPRERMKESYATADVFLVSLKEGLSGYIVPSKLYGILAAGRPYVAAVEPDSEVARITDQFQTGLVVAPGDVGGMAHAISGLYRDRGLAERLGRNARKASSEFEKTKQIRAYHELFTSELRNERARTDAALQARS